MLILFSSIVSISPTPPASPFNGFSSPFSGSFFFFFVGFRVFFYVAVSRVSLASLSLCVFGVLYPHGKCHLRFRKKIRLNGMFLIFFLFYSIAVLENRITILYNIFFLSFFQHIFWLHNFLDIEVFNLKNCFKNRNGTLQNKRKKNLFFCPLLVSLFLCIFFVNRCCHPRFTFLFFFF